MENETCTASCALVQPVGTTKGQVLLVKQFHMPGPFYNIKKCYLLNKCTNVVKPVRAQLLLYFTE